MSKDPDRLRILARAELQRHDFKVMRKVEAIVAGKAWCAWRDELRLIASNPEAYDDELPPEPPFGDMAEPVIEAVIEPTPEPEPEIEATPEPTPELVAEPEAPVEPEPAPVAEPEPHPFAGLIDPSKAWEDERLRLRARYLFLHHMLVDQSGGLPDLSPAERDELNDLQTRNIASGNVLEVTV